MHHVGIVLAGKHVPGATHIGGQLIDLVEPGVDHVAAEPAVAQIADREVIGRGVGKLGVLHIDAAHP